VQWVPTSDTAATFDNADDGTTVECSITASDIDASENVIRRGRRAVNRSLDRYYDGGIEGLTDEMYDEAPYEVQRHYRRLDEQLEAAADKGQMTLDGGKNEKRTRETLYNFIEAFPEDEFPEFSDDLSIWYRLMSADLDSEDYDRIELRIWPRTSGGCSAWSWPAERTTGCHGRTSLGN